MVSVCRYNHDIADYALTVASPAASGEALAAMLIKSSQPSSLAVTPAPNILPALAVEPLPLPPPPIQIWKNEPTLAVRPLTPTSVDPQLQSPWTSPAAHVKNEPTWRRRTADQSQRHERTDAAQHDPAGREERADVGAAPPVSPMLSQHVEAAVGAVGLKGIQALGHTAGPRAVEIDTMATRFATEDTEKKGVSVFNFLPEYRTLKPKTEN